MTKLEIIEEILVNKYAANPSLLGLSPNGYRCVYHNKESGNKCAVGTCMTQEAIEKFGNFSGPISVLLSENNVLLDEILESKYHGHDVSFWRKLQSFHDNEFNFNETGLTAEGIKYLNELRAFCLKN